MVRQWQQAGSALGVAGQLQQLQAGSLGSLLRLASGAHTCSEAAAAVAWVAWAALKRPVHGVLLVLLAQARQEVLLALPGRPAAASSAWTTRAQHCPPQAALRQSSQGWRVRHGPAGLGRVRPPGRCAFVSVSEAAMVMAQADRQKCLSLLVLLCWCKSRGHASNPVRTVRPTLHQHCSPCRSASSSCNSARDASHTAHDSKARASDCCTLSAAIKPIKRRPWQQLRAAGLTHGTQTSSPKTFDSAGSTSGAQASRRAWCACGLHGMDASRLQINAAVCDPDSACTIRACPLPALGCSQGIAGTVGPAGI